MLAGARHLVRQRHMLAALGQAAVDALRHGARAPHADADADAESLPGPEVCVRLPPPAASLVEDFVRELGDDPTHDRASIPASLFPYWGLPVALQALKGRHLPLLKLVNGGCRLQENAPLLRDRDLTVRARLMSVTGDERRRVLCQRIVTEQAGSPDALIADVYAVVRSRRPSGPVNRKPLEPLPEAAREVEAWQLTRDAGLRFALLTGDVNPLHWLAPYARLLGYEGAILHGFAALARAHAGLGRAFGRQRVSLLDVRFVRPIPLPARLSLYVDGSRLFVAARGQAPCVTGSFTLA